MMSRRDQTTAALEDARRLHAMWKAGRLGGENMPEDVHPDIARDGDELAAYFTLGMTLNYQRNSYALWRACTAMFKDAKRRWVFDPARAANAGISDLRDALGHHRVALQPNRHPDIWRRNAMGLCVHAGGSVRRLFELCGDDIGRVRDLISQRKSDFPYLNGPKISNYWLYVMSQYMRWPLTGRATLSIAPDTNVIAASFQLGLIDATERGLSRLPDLVAERWCEVLNGSEFTPIDLHTPLWLWSRAGFPEIVS